MRASSSISGVVELAPQIRQQADGLQSLKNKKLFIHNRDEEFSFDKLRTGLRGTTQFVN
jgi:beta-xylosidase